MADTQKYSFFRSLLSHGLLRLVDGSHHRHHYASLFPRGHDGARGVGSFSMDLRLFRLNRLSFHFLGLFPFSFTLVIVSSGDSTPTYTHTHYFPTHAQRSHIQRATGPAHATRHFLGLLYPSSHIHINLLQPECCTTH
ncbi:uncharacterized protein K452DRAFT_18840 [Aplosporella prunicola CBS 121167]|uniref:Uncharacterized protein n=1 Tax=Aplosporella prunicola CBS 121167 TaxID=1176127 RepID=A0A6A6BFV0_9PEZI|nr:uncharacterized protein K452DRAFT_18840 [Aplosporella prunicola CBS 121167]KAF2142438.1 hypothetical protein K452DRAFT_18840 [Aplosporella prunicola CBS 121167]